jgi:hypothetical protein
VKWWEGRRQAFFRNKNGLRMINQVSIVGDKKLNR